MKAGYRFFYCIDADDLKNYAFPLGLFGERSDERNLSFEYITDEQIALYSMFNKNDFKAFVLDNHLEEIGHLVKKVRYLHQQGGRLVNTSRELLAKLKKFSKLDNLDELKNEISVIRENISLILSIAVGLQADGVDKLSKLQNSKKIMFDEDELHEQLNAYPVRETYTILREKLADEIFYFLKDKDVNTPIQRYKKKVIDSELETVKRDTAHRRDSDAIAKVIDINKSLHNAGIRVIILYISSDHKTQNIFYRKNKIYESIRDLLGAQSIIVGDTLVNYHRNTAQMFLRLLCDEDEPDKIIVNLQQVRDIIEIRESMDNDNNAKQHMKSDAANLDSILEQKIDKYRKEFEDYSTFIRIDEFKDLLQGFRIKTADDSDAKQIVDILAELIQQKENNILEWRYSVELRLKELSQLTVVRNTLSHSLDMLIQEQIAKGNFQAVGVGRDYVFNKAHYLPTYFPNAPETHKPAFREIVIRYNDTSANLRQFILDFATRLFSLKGSIDELESLDELLLKRCMLVLLLSNSKYYGEVILDQIDTLLNKYNFQDSSLSSHFYYVLTWVERRNQKYEEALQHTNIALQRFPEDPRFYHSLGLIQYCQSELLNHKAINLLKDSLKNCRTACLLYQRAADTEKNEHQRDILLQNIDALTNGQAFLLSLGYQHDEFNECFTREVLDEARNLMEILKSDSHYRENANYLHTEALLSYLFFKADADTSKCREAIQLIEEALALPHDERIGEMYRSFRTKIESELYDYIKM